MHEYCRQVNLLILLKNHLYYYCTLNYLIFKSVKCSSYLIRIFEFQSTACEDFCDFAKTCRNRFKSKKSLMKNKRLGYLPVKSIPEFIKAEPVTQSVSVRLDNLKTDSTFQKEPEV